VVRLTPHTGPLCPDLDRFLRFASACFRQKRKTLGNNLASLYPRNLLEAQAESGLRAEQLSVRELLELHARLG
jgi:16S rRNA A1518/A1519 N6-dimethyltransferase RsmA/KsgA/DIM1 with predicted DNA glycosylase/AP lyase activity